MTASTKIVGRDAELDSLQAFLAASERGPAALVISGEPGIGKTVLWEAVIEDARNRFARVLSCRGLEAEASFAFAGLSELLSGTLDEVLEALPAPRRRALEVALLLVEPGEQPPDSHAIGLALLDVLRALSEQGPVLIALDDVQWLDASSAAVLQVALRRLRAEPVGVLATVRETPDASVPFELEPSFPGERLIELSLEPLSLGALHHLLGDRLGLELTRGDLVRVQQASGGNPFFALELARQGARLGPGQVMSVPGSLGTLLGERLARLPEETREVLLIAAAAGRATVDVIAVAHGNRADTEEALEPALREGVIETDDSRVRFTHPLLASVCLEGAPARDRRAAHAALAAAVSDIEEQGRHLALAAEGPETGVAARLDDAAEHAAARGATATAAELSELAVVQTPNADTERAMERRLRAANLRRLSGDLERAIALLEQLLAAVPSGLVRADALLELATTRRDDVPTMLKLCDEALAEAAGDEARSARILAYRSWAHQFEAAVDDALLDARSALDKAERVGDPTLLAIAIAQVATGETRAAEITPGLLERGIEIEEHLAHLLEYHESPRVAFARRLIGTGELDRARALLEEVEGDAATWGNEELRGWALRGLARVEWYAGRLERALDRMGEAVEIWEEIGSRHGRAVTACFRALVEADLGQVEDARASAEEGLALSRTMSDEEWEILSIGALGRLELMLGNLEVAGRHMRELPRRLLLLGYHDPTVPLWADAIETLISLGELELARAYLESYETHARRTGSPLAVAGAARCRGLLAAAEGDLKAAVETHDAALAKLEAHSYPLERGRTLLCLGSAHRQAKQKRLARDALEEAIAIFDRLGAPLWAEKARAELRRISGRRRASEEELTEMEERIARMASQGRSNKEIAAELFVSVHTVGAHLSRAYRKVGVHSRTELAARLSPSAEKAT